MPVWHSSAQKSSYTRHGDQPAALDCFKQIYEVDYGYRDIAKRVEESYAD